MWELSAERVASHLAQSQDVHRDEDLGLKQWKGVSRSELEVAEHSSMAHLASLKVPSRPWPEKG